MRCHLIQCTEQGTKLSKVIVKCDSCGEWMHKECMGLDQMALVEDVCVEWGSTNTAGTLMFKIPSASFEGSSP